VSRTKRGSRPVGYDYWSKRPGNKGGISGHGPDAKKRTRRTERQQGKTISNEENK
jgi:hypothetical protein